MGVCELTTRPLDKPQVRHGNIAQVGKSYTRKLKESFLREIKQIANRMRRLSICKL